MQPIILFGEVVTTINEKLELGTRKALEVINNHRRIHESFEPMDEDTVDLIRRSIKVVIVQLWRKKNSARSLSGVYCAEELSKQLDSEITVALVANEEYLTNTWCIDHYSKSMENLFGLLSRVRESYHLPPIPYKKRYNDDET